MWGWGYLRAIFWGAGSGSGEQIITPTGVPSSLAIGTANVIQVFIQPPALSFFTVGGNPTVTAGVTLLQVGGGDVSGDVGTPTITLAAITLSPVSVASTFAMGAPTVSTNKFIFPPSIPSGSFVGGQTGGTKPRVDKNTTTQVIFPTAIPGPGFFDFGVPTMVYVISPTGITSAFVMGSTAVAMKIQLLAGVPSGLAIGNHLVQLAGAAQLISVPSVDTGFAIGAAIVVTRLLGNIDRQACLQVLDPWPIGEAVEANSPVWSIIELADGVQLASISTYGGHILRSTDWWTSWETIAITKPQFPEGLKALHLYKVSNAIIVAVAEPIVGNAGVYRSTNGGATWAFIQYFVGVKAIPAAIADGNNVYIMTVGASPTFAVKVWKSTDQGLTYVEKGSITNWGIYEYGSLAKSNGVLLAGVNNRIWSSVNDAVTWTAGQVFGSASVGPILKLSPTRFILAGKGGNAAVFLSTNTGVTWTNVFQTTDFSFLQAFANLGEGRIVAGSSLGKLYWSQDNGLTWTQLQIIDSVYSLLAVAPDHFFVGSQPCIWENTAFAFPAGSPETILGRCGPSLTVTIPSPSVVGAEVVE